MPRLGRRALVVLATSAVAGLGAAGPAFASDLPQPPPAPPAIPIPELPPELAEPPVVVTEIDAESIDVSVRVLSPGEDAAPAPEVGADAVIPPVPEIDTTAEAAVDGDEAAEDVPGTPDPGVNTNVSVRVLSPGSNAGTSTETPRGGGDVATAGAAPVAPTPEAAPAATTTSEDAPDSEQYHDGNSQYQSESDIAQEPWNWVWILTVDCEGNPTSSSADSGDPESLDWSWEWTWEWGCSDGQRAEPERASTSEQPPVTSEPRPPPDSESQPSDGAAATTSEPWSWTWTFSWCGRETTVSTLGGAGTPLTWTWDWTWVWSCATGTPAAEPGEAGAAPPSVPLPAPVLPATLSAPSYLGAATSPSQDAQPGPETTPLTAVSPSVVTFAFDTGGTTAILEVPPAPGMHSVIAVDVAIPPAIPLISAAPTTVPLQVRPFPLGAAPLELGPHAVVSRPVHGPSATTTRALPTTPVLLPRTASAGARHASRPEPHKQRRAQVVRARPDSRPSLPLVPRSRHGAASTSASGAASSALLVGIVALAGFVLLAAPGLGRRLEVARELSPRGLDRSPIDHPG